MKFIVIAVLVFVLFSSSTPKTQHKELKQTQHKAMHYLTLTEDDGKSGCTAYAIATHVLLTAQHCDLHGTFTVDEESLPQEVIEKVFDGKDHMLLVMPNETFLETVVYDPATYRPPVQGEHVYFWGNPAALRDIYREGYFMGTADKPEGVSGNGKVFLFAILVGSGDSGSSIFGNDGRLISVVTFGMNDGSIMGGYPLQFTAGQVKQAENVR